MKIFVEISNKEVNNSLKNLKSFSFVKSAKAIKPDHAKFYKNLDRAFKEVSLYKQGKIKLRTLDELLDEV